MTHALPERIWVKTHSGKRTSGFWQDAPFLPNMPENIGTEYVPADLVTAAHAAGYREGLEAAAAWHEEQMKLFDAILVHTKMSARRALWCEMADLHEKSAAALRALQGDTP